jgi:hypothetical protein
MVDMAVRDNPANLRAFGICRTCSEIFPSERGCPRCDNDVDAAREVSAAREVAVAAIAAEAPRHVQAQRRHPAQWKPVLAVIGVSLLVSTVVAVLTQA